MDKSIKNFYNEDSSRYESERFLSSAGKYADSTHKQIVFSLVDSWEGKRVLDLGCGTGRFSLEAANKGSTVVGIDFSSEMLKILNQKANRNVYPVMMDAHKLAVTDTIFDGCICINALHLISDYENVLGEIGRVLKPNGFLILNLPNLLGLYFPIGLFVNMTKKSVLRDVFSKWFTISEIRDALSSAGMEIDEIKGYMPFPTNTPEAMLSMLKILDRVSRNSFLKYISGSIFIRATKVR
jgi:ubiquinone/menaquinone biosynthesis C-methylase UbiE